MKIYLSLVIATFCIKFPCIPKFEYNQTPLIREDPANPSLWSKTVFAFPRLELQIFVVKVIISQTLGLIVLANHMNTVIPTLKGLAIRHSWLRWWRRQRLNYCRCCSRRIAGHGQRNLSSDTIDGGFWQEVRGICMA